MEGSAPESNQEWIYAGDKRIPLHAHVLLIGIVNVTPDSFSDGGQYLDPEVAVDHAQAMVDEGADIIDVGGESTRPGADLVDEEEEVRRLRPVLQMLSHRVSVPVSVDTRKAAVAKMAIDLGAVMINDVSALQCDPAMGQVVAEAKAGLVLMHMPGTPQTMQQNCSYQHVVQEVTEFLSQRVQKAQEFGITKEQIIVDPGIGFGKNVEQNLALLRGIYKLRSIGRPVLVGVSNKSFLGHIVDKQAGERVMGTAAAVAAVVLNGAHLVRVHDVGLMRDVVKTSQAIRGGSLN